IRLPGLATASSAVPDVTAAPAKASAFAVLGTSARPGSRTSSRNSGCEYAVWAAAGPVGTTTKTQAVRDKIRGQVSNQLGRARAITTRVGQIADIDMPTIVGRARKFRAILVRRRRQLEHSPTDNYQR